MIPLFWVLSLILVGVEITRRTVLTVIAPVIFK